MKKVVKKQYELLRDKIEHQAHLVLKKFKPNKGSEVSNQDISLLMAQGATQYQSLSEEEQEKVNTLLVKLDKTGMEIIRLTHWEGKSLREIGLIMGKSHQWVSDQLEKAYSTMRT